MIGQVTSVNAQEALPNYTRYVLASLGNLNIVCPDVFVAEIMIVERSELLPIPFFDRAILGLVHHQGLIVPLVSLKRALLKDKVLVPERITVVRLSDEIEAISGAGLVVDRVISSISSKQYEQMQVANAKSSQFEYMRLESLLPHLGQTIWEPQRWHSSVSIAKLS
jgi:chemotaxis signal transduction protein